jgi:hypothetical protein
MVKSEQYTCKLCKRMYSSASSLCNHTTKFHKNNTYNHHNHSYNHNNNIDNHPIIIDNADANSEKKYKCKTCNKEFSYYQNRWRHEKTCMKEIIENPPSNIISNNNITNNSNNTTTNNGTINNIIINSYDKDDLKYISNDFMKRILNRLSKTDDESLKGGIPHLVENIKFNPTKKMNNNVIITNSKSKIAKKYIDKKWNYVKKNDILKEMHNKALEILQTWVSENKEELTKKMLDGLKDYKNISLDYKKTVIHEEINLIGYNYYKNHMENDLD